MKILIVEDEPKTGDYLKKGLVEAGFVVDLCRNGIDGAHLGSTETYDVVVLDVMLPGIDGWEVLNALRKAGKEMPVMFLTARDQVEARVKGLELGADDDLVKPFAFSEFLARIRTLLRRGKKTEPERLSVSDLSLDLLKRRAMRSGQAVHQGHAPLRKIIAQIRRITTDRLHIRLLPATVPIELAELATSFNEMLERIEEVFRKLANFSDDIAHELRTPVTNLMAQTQVALSSARSMEEYREVLYSNLEEYGRMAQMLGDMLYLAKADNGQLKPSITEVDLASEIRALFEYFEAWAEERAVSLALAGAAPAVTGDRLMLRRAISNPLSNAIRHTAHGSTVTVRSGTVGD